MTEQTCTPGGGNRGPILSPKDEEEADESWMGSFRPRIGLESSDLEPELTLVIEGSCPLDDGVGCNREGS